MTTAEAIPQKRLVLTDIPGPRSRALQERWQDAVPAGWGSKEPVFAARAWDGIVEDVDGNRLVDLGSGIAVVNSGHSAPEVAAAVAEQAAQFLHTCAMVTPYELYHAVCAELNRRTPGDHPKRSLLVNSGAEAVENAVKVARLYTGRPGVVVFEHAFHGRTNLAMTLTAKAKPYRSGFGPVAPEVYRVPMAYPYRWPSGPQRCAEEAAEAVITAVRSQIGAERVACLVVEPVQGEGGVVVPAEGFLPRIARFCADEGILLVGDEVQTGFGRTGAWFACEHEQIVPDLVTTGKGIAGGLPLAGVTGRAEIMDAVHPGGIGSTFGGNPVSCAAAMAVIERMETLRLVERAQAIGTTALERLRALARTTPAIGDVRGRGAMIGVELVSDPEAKTPAPELTNRVLAECRNEGVIILKAGTFDNVVRLLPPLSMSDELLGDALDVLTEVIGRVTRAV